MNATETMNAIYALWENHQAKQRRKMEARRELAVERAEIVKKAKVIPTYTPEPKKPVERNLEGLTHYRGELLDLNRHKDNGERGASTYPDDTKKKIVALIDTGKAKPIEVVRDLGLHVQTVQGWRKQYSQNAPTFKKRYTEKQKAHAMKLIEHGIPAAYVSAETGVGISSVKKWITDRNIDIELKKSIDTKTTNA
jgi:hypothetical protein